MSERGSLEARLCCFKAITDFDSRNGEKTNSAANRLVVVVIGVAAEIERARGARIEAIEGRPVGNIKGVVRTGRTDRKSPTHFGADRYIWQDAMVNSKRTVGQFVDPLRLESFDENITRTEEFSGAQGYVIVKQIGELRVHEIHIGAAATGLDLEPALE